MAAAHERRKDELDLLGLAVHDRLDVREEALSDLECAIELGGRLEWRCLGLHGASILGRVVR
jgi:hypothetical protein